jgi:nucleotide-binding universal stress UspA family protein
VFRHILIATDGSRLAARGVRTGIGFARALGARVSGAYVMQPAAPRGGGEELIAYAGLSAREWSKSFEAAARKALAVIEIEAQLAKVPCATAIVRNARPWKGILAAAHRRGCDAIVVASHGRSGLGGLLLGSETNSVLSHSRIPVLVTR